MIIIVLLNIIMLSCVCVCECVCVCVCACVHVCARVAADWFTKVINADRSGARNNHTFLGSDPPLYTVNSPGLPRCDYVLYRCHRIHQL